MDKHIIVDKKKRHKKKIIEVKRYRIIEEKGMIEEQMSKEGNKRSAEDKKKTMQFQTSYMISISDISNLGYHYSRVILAEYLRHDVHWHASHHH